MLLNATSAVLVLVSPAALELAQAATRAAAARGALPCVTADEVQVRGATRLVSLERVAIPPLAPDAIHAEEQRGPPEPDAILVWSHGAPVETQAVIQNALPELVSIRFAAVTQFAVALPNAIPRAAVLWFVVPDAKAPFAIQSRAGSTFSVLFWMLPDETRFWLLVYGIPPDQFGVILSISAPRFWMSNEVRAQF